MNNPLSKPFFNWLGSLTQSKLAIAWIARTSPNVKYFHDTDQPIIALTIDDGPDPRTTPKILETLGKYDAKATFFITTSRIKGCESIIEAIVDHGHELGNHLTEDSPSIFLTDDEFEADLLKAHSMLEKFESPVWMRPASGWYRPSMVAIANKRGYQVALGCIFPFDTFLVSSDFAADFILSKAFPGAIIVMHDTGTWGEETAKTLDMVLPELSHQGYKILTLSNLFAP